MGKVVKLDQAAADRSAGGPRNRRRPRRSKSALVLGGGGFTGGVYEIGALRALDLLSVNRTVNEFDVYVGTSAGSFVAAAVSNGVTPEEMMRVIVQQVPTPFPDASVSSLLRPNYGEFLTKGLLVPFRVVQLLRTLVRDFGQMSAVDLAIGLAEALPSGIYSGQGIERYVRTILSDPDRSDDFRLLKNELYLAATDLDTCERIVFGAEDWDDVPISTAVRASSALPMVYKPVKVKDRELIDGGILSTTNLDIAVEAGAKFIVVVNPLVPYVNDFEKRIPTITGSRSRRVSDMGFPQIGYQAFKLLAYQRLHEVARRWEERYPGVDIILIEPEPNDELMFQTSMMNYTSRVDIILIEPEPNDELMFQTSMMNYTSRVDIARHGFQSVTLKLAHDYPRFKRICARHGIDISATRVRKVVKHFEAEREKTRAWRKILEQTTSTLLRQSAEE
jgi:predicted acylesterase/phospholipase RssA